MIAHGRALAQAQNSIPPELVTQIRAPDQCDAPNLNESARVNPGMLTVKNLIDSFTTHLAMLVRSGVNEPATLRWYVDTLKRLDPVAGFAADALRTFHLTDISPTNALVRALKRLYKWGAAEGLVTKDPFAKLAIPPCGQRERVLTRTELRRLYRVSSRAFRRLLFVQFGTLARPGEIRQLTWGQIDWRNRVIMIVKYKGKKLRRDQLKARAIPLSRPVLRLLQNLYRKSEDQTVDGRVFIAQRGKPWTPNGVRCAMRVARRRAGLGEGDEPAVCYHLRHTGATNAVRMDINLKLVAEVMGHARTETTERYCHLNTKDLVGTIDRMTARPRAAS